MKSREYIDIFSSGRESEKVSKKLKEFEESERKRLVEDVKKSPEFQKFLESIDFELLRSLFEDVIKRTGLDLKGANFLGPDRITSEMFSDNNHGEYRIDSNLIGLSYIGVKKRSELKGLNLNLLLLRGFIHEETHAVSKSACYGTGDVRTGFQTNTRASWILLDEAVTEKLSGEVFEEYLRTKPDFANHDDKQIFRVGYNSIYSQGIKLLELLIDRISKDQGVPIEVVWTGLVRSKLEGESLWEEETREFFNSISPDFFERLQKATTKEDVEYLIQKLTQSLPSTP